MSKDNLEYVEGGILRDRFGRKEYTLRGLHQAKLTGEALEGGTIVDADKREQIVLRDVDGNIVTHFNSSGIPGWYNIVDYGASTSSNDNTAAIQAAMDAAKAGQGKVYVPPGQWKFASPLVANTWAGGGISGYLDGGGEGVSPSSQLQYTGTGSTPAIKLYSIFGWALTGLRFTYTSSSFTGDLIDIDGQPNAADCTAWVVRGCSWKTLTSVTARSCIRLNKAINGVIYNCGFGGAVNSLRYADPGGGYVVGVKTYNCTFDATTDAHVLLGGVDLENITFDDCRFEAGITTPGIRGATVAVDGADHNTYGLEISNCWFGDASGTVNWVSGLRGVFNGSIIVRGCWFGDNNTGTHVSCDPAFSSTLTLIGNYFNSGGNVFKCTTGSPVTLIGNLINGPTNLCNDGGSRPTDFTVFANRTAGATSANTAFPTLPGRIAIGTGQSSGLSGTTITGGPGGNKESLILGASDSTSLSALGNKAGAYTRLGGFDTGTHSLILQAPTDDASRQVIIAAGTTPTAKFACDGNGIGFFGNIGVGKPSAYTLNAGATSRNLASGATLANVEQVLRQVITDLISYGLLQ